ncbi:MAG: ABC transporter permease [Eubacteriales bacterium]|nr:ABC transporter permease [Eubacteriales bacterium]
MKQLWTVFEFELMNFVKAKSFVITTILVAVLLGGATFLPRFIDLSDMLGIESTKKDSDKDDKEQQDEEKEAKKIAIYDESGYFEDLTVLTETFSQAEEEATFEKKDSEADLKKAVENEEVDAGFYVVDDLHYYYYVVNNSFADSNAMVFEQLLSMIHKQAYCAEQGIDFVSFAEGYDAPVEGEVQVLGKDMENSFWYCYALVIVVFMIIVLYGTMIATSVTSEKSNRAIEVLVTSVNADCLLFGKVFAGAVAAIVQVGVIMASALIGYSVNHTYWGDKLDMLLNIPGSVLLTFAVFGIGGFLFYAFLYGAMGALVSKTEDINKTAGSLQMVIMVVYFVVLAQLQNVDGTIMKVCSYLPISSYSAMFVRIGMGKVSMVEVVISAIILYASIFFAGWIGARIYRMGTLRYGNPIKIGKALKELKNVE